MGVMLLKSMKHISSINSQNKILYFLENKKVKIKTSVLLIDRKKLTNHGFLFVKITGEKIKMKKISRIQASKRILQIAKAVAEVEASNKKLTPFEIAKVQKTVATILASADLDNETLEQIQALQDEQQQVNINNGVKELLKNKTQLNKIKNVQLKSEPTIKQYLKQNGIMITKPMKVGKFFEVIKTLLVDFENIANVEEQLN